MAIIQGNQVKLNNGQVVLVDQEDFNDLKIHKWYLDHRGYAIRHEKKNEYRDRARKIIKMHRFIMKAKDGEFIDHINRNPLDNRKINLRIATNSQNQANSALFKSNKTGYKGVIKYNQKKPWAAQIHVQGKRVFKGMFNTKEEAALKYNELAKKYFGEFANLNIVY